MFRNPNNITYKNLIKSSRKSLQYWIAIKRNAESNDKIYRELISLGYHDKQIPSWFARGSLQNGPENYTLKKPPNKKLLTPQPPSSPKYEQNLSEEININERNQEKKHCIKGVGVPVYSHNELLSGSIDLFNPDRSTYSPQFTYVPPPSPIQVEQQKLVEKYRNRYIKMIKEDEEYYNNERNRTSTSKYIKYIVNVENNITDPTTKTMFLDLIYDLYEQETNQYSSSDFFWTWLTRDYIYNK